MTAFSSCSKKVLGRLLAPFSSFFFFSEKMNNANFSIFLSQLLVCLFGILMSTYQNQGATFSEIQLGLDSKFFLVFL
jgi:hypothetical protein